MAGNTATICVETFRRQWDDGVPMAVLCATWTITKDQIIRLKSVWQLPLRHDRARKRSQQDRVSRSDMAASIASLDLAPSIASAAAAIQRGWSLEVEHSRRGTHSGGPSDRPSRVVSLSVLQSVVKEHQESE